VKVLHLNRFFYSGQTTHVFSLVKEQQKQGHLAHLAIEGYPSTQALDIYKKTIENVNATVIRPGDENTLTRLIKQFKYDLLHAHSPLTFPITQKLSRQFKIPFVVTCHGLGLNKDEYKPCFKEAGALFCISQRVANGLHHFADKIHVIANGVDLDEFKPGYKCDPVKIALVSRIDSGKQNGYHHLCKAIDLLEGVNFFVASNKPPLSATAKYLGWTDNISSLLAKTDIVIGTGRAIIEGLAAGNAALILGRTYHGLLTPEKMQKQQYWDLSGLSGSDPCYKNIFFDLAKLTQNPIYLQKVQEAGRKLAEQHFDNRVICKQTLDVYTKVFRKKNM
jgi:alpha-maltose-1-phosphate synthase